MRADLAPVTSAALERIKLLLLNMARQATLVALDDITARIQQLEARPTQLDDFVNYMVSSACTRSQASQLSTSANAMLSAGVVLYPLDIQFCRGVNEARTRICNSVIWAVTAKHVCVMLVNMRGGWLCKLNRCCTRASWMTASS